MYEGMDFRGIFYLAIFGLLCAGAGIAWGIWWLWVHVSLVVQ